MSPCGPRTPTAIRSDAFCARSPRSRRFRRKPSCCSLHGLPFRGIPLRVAQLRAHHDARLAELHDAIAGAAQPLSAADVLPVLFRRELDLQQRFFAMGEALAHLNHLWRGDRLRRVGDPAGGYRFAVADHR